MQDDPSQQLHQRLIALRESIQRDSAALQAGRDRFPDGQGGQAIFDRLFDAVESTLQNTDESSADGPG